MLPLSNNFTFLSQSIMKGDILLHEPYLHETR